MRGKVAVITGSSMGIGKATARILAREGAKIVINGRTESRLQQTEKEFKETGLEVLAIAADIATLAGATQLITETIKHFGQIDILINNGGISQRSLAADTEVSVDRRIMEVNYFGTIEITKHLLPYFKKQGRGHLAIVSSLVGKFGTPYRSGYAASKHALHGFFDSLRTEVHDENIKVTMICPGFIRTNVSINALTEKGEKLNQMDQAQANGMPVDKFSRKMIRAIEKDKSEVYIGGKEKYGVLVKRFLPSLFNILVRKASVR